MNDRHSAAWPALAWQDWSETAETLHRWTQVVGKVRLALAPMVNHWWQVALYVTARGLTTSPIPYGATTFAMTFDFIDHVLRIETNTGTSERLALTPMSVADFYAAVMTRRARSRTRCRSMRTVCTPPTTRPLRIVSGACWRAPIR
jgi:hypothetical protein